MSQIENGNKLQEVMLRIGSRPALIRAANAGDFFGGGSPYEVNDGVALINITGPLLNEKCAGCTFYGDIQDQLKIAAADSTVRAVVLNVNSPGGQTDNAFETAALVASLGKPCYAVAGTMAYSAAYLIASQADKIYCVQTSGGVGSIGVYCAHVDMSGMMDQMGIKVTLVSAGKGKTDGNPYEPLSSEALANIQADIDRLYGEFVGAVATGRKMAAKDIVMLGARCFDGAKAAIGAGLADAPGDLSDAIAGIRSELARASAPVKPATKQATAKTAAEIVYEQAIAEAHAEAAAIVQAVTAAGRDITLAGEFIQKKMSLAAVKRELIRQSWRRVNQRIAGGQ